MAITPAGLAAAITTQQGTAINDPSEQDRANLDLATAIVNYLIANAVINTTVPASAISTPSGGAGPLSPVPLTGTIS